MDTKTPEERSRNMAKIRSGNTKPEKLVRSMLFRLGYRFRLKTKILPGHPDIVLPGRKIAVFVHGCFWHSHTGCSKATIPSSNRTFWEAKLKRNRERDILTKDEILKKGWRVLWVWECALRTVKMREGLSLKIRDFIEGEDTFGEISGKYSQINPPKMKS